MLNWIINIQHKYNPLHVHCRLVERGMSKTLSLSICKCYEVLVYSWLAWFSIVGAQVYRILRPVD
ncbi:MAG: hypothetical protein JRD47_00185 [Deltaproteobacteria bacterium]|nr:hypothetical protein [Deltaproteobacteria bacterium]MBW2317180.1 hypothetical protein [Deltaproteobacteria bacterium]MBW2600337.1 hypothetical protein [Deltaproteobacteria bacterium]